MAVIYFKEKKTQQDPGNGRSNGCVVIKAK